MELNDSIQELKKISAIPQLKNGETLGNRVKRAASGDQSNLNINPIQMRLRSCNGDPYQAAQLMTDDIKIIADQIFGIWNKMIELVTINPKFVTEFLRIIYEEKMREYWGEHIYRTIVETKDFAIPSEDNVGEIHRQIALQRRASLAEEKSK